MSRKLLISGERANFTVLALDIEENNLTVAAEYPAPFNASWVEPFSSQANIDCLIGLSEGESEGLLYTFEIDHSRQTCGITSQRITLGAPAHFTTLRDRSVVALATYMGGTVATFPVSIDDKNRLLLTDVPRVDVVPEFAYSSTRHGPDKTRQRQCHVHHIIEDDRGFLYAADLGSDRVWVIRRDGLQAAICGWLQCPPGTGPRHAVINDDKLMYVIGELSHAVIAFDISIAPAEGVQPITGFASSVVPPTVRPEHSSKMDSAEICLHPNIPNVLYVSNRLERHIAELEPDLKDVPTEVPPGDAIAVILLSGDGRAVESIRHVRTNLDVIRGMRLSEDGKYVVVVGQEGGGVEVYEIKGQRGDVWSLVASLNEGLESGIKHAVWL